MGLRGHNGGGYSDWYLPSTDELNKLYLNRVAIGGFETRWFPYYWSSSEGESYAHCALLQLFRNGSQFDISKDFTQRVRAVRSF